MQDMPPVDCPVTHNFIPGFYIRTVVMAKGMIVTSRIHNTEHPFHVSKGKCLIRVNDDDWEEVEAPYSGVTFPDTRRVLYMEEDTTFTTFHPILESEYPSQMLEEEVSESLDKIEKRIIKEHVNPLLGGVIRNNVLTKTIQNDLQGIV